MIFLKYKYILLDIDGTLINFDESFRAASHKILTLDKTPATDDNINAYYKINDDAWYSLDMENMEITSGKCTSLAARKALGRMNAMGHMRMAKRE